ncbi:MAG: universal stress protein [Longimicrobiales bacterium]
MFRHIVIPLDGSAFSRTAIPYAHALASNSDAELELVSAVDTAAALLGAGYPGDLAAGATTSGAGVPAVAIELVEASREGREEELEATARKVGTATGGTVDWTVIDGEPSETVAARVEESEADLVVMSTHGRGGLDRAWLGSVADRLIRRLTVPLLLVRPEEEEGNGEEADPESHDDGPELSLEPARIQRVLVPLDGSELAEAILDPAARLARQTGASLVLLRVMDPRLPTDAPYLPATVEGTEARFQERRTEARDYLDRVAERLRGEGVEVADVEVREGSAAPTILEQAGEGADIVAMATHGRGGLRRWLLGSVSDKVLRGADRPVLIVRPEDED